MSAHVSDALEALRTAGAPQFDPRGWHYLQTLGQRAGRLNGQAQALLHARLQSGIAQLHERMAAAARATPPHRAQPSPSALAALLQDMPAHRLASGHSQGWPAENPRIQQFRQQLSQIRVQKQVKQAMALAPANAGPINSHMLVLRALGWMRDISPPYLNRFMAHVDTLLCLDSLDKDKPLPKKGPTGASRAR